MDENLADMAQAESGSSFAGSHAGKASKDRMTDVKHWILQQEEADAEADAKAEAQAEANRFLDNLDVVLKKKGQNNRGMAIVTGRPAGNPVGPKTNQKEELPPLIDVDLGGKNWVGLLQEYRNANSSTTGPDYQETTTGSGRFTCSVSIGESPSPISNPVVIFTRKKDAKQYAAKVGVDWLISQNLMPSDGSASFPKPKSTSPASAISPKNDSPSYGLQVAQLCTKLGMKPPTYIIVPYKDFPTMYSGYADFDGNSLVEGRPGAFTNVHGKKKAKETCAKEILPLLEGILKRKEGLMGSQWE